MKAFVAVLIAVGLALGVYAVIGANDARVSGLAQQLADIAEEGNSHLPMMVDAQTRLDSMVASSDTFEYAYTLVGHSADQVNREAFEAAIRPYLTTSLCSSEDNELFRANDLNVVYTYYASDGDRVASIAIPTSVCNAAA